MKKIVLLAFILILSAELWAQTPAPVGSPYLDTTFNKGSVIRGRKLLDSLQGNFGAMASDSYGKIVTVSYGTKTIEITRLNPDGSYDAKFGSKGFKKIALPDTNSILCVTTQTDGKILIGGQKSNIAKDMFLMRLNNDGSLDNSFDNDGYWTYNFGGNDQLDEIFVQKDNKIIIAGKKGTGIVVTRLNTDATFDLNFGTNGFISTTSFIQSVGSLDIDADNMIYIAGDSGSYSLRVLKLLPGGTYDNGFAKAGILRGAAFGSGTPPVGIAVQTDGKILVAGSNSPYSFSALRFQKSGQADSSFGINGTATYSCYYSPMKSLLLDNDGGIVMTGSYSYYDFRLMRLDTKGFVDSTFGSSGSVIIQNPPTSSQAVLSRDGKYLMYTKETSGFFVYKINNQSDIHLIGPSFVAPKSYEAYKITLPSSMSTGATYKWVYSGKYFNYSPNQTSNPLTLLFSDTATSGKLTCTITSAAAVVLGRVETDIIVNSKPSFATQLASLDCSTKLSSCSIGYIDNFTLNTLINAGSGCSKNGYVDYTQSDFTDTLAAGGVYTAKLKIPNDGTVTNYVGIWIDYNNDGNFSNIDEFVGEGYASTSKLDVNIFLKNREGYDGPKRLRVRSRPDTKFSSSESCPPLGGELGETEDYLIILSKQPTLEAPQIITPNEDGLNDYFVIHGADPNKENKLTVFDRIGAVKYSSANYENDWNGVGKDGNKLSPGTYYYVVSTGKTSIKGFLEIRY